MAKISTIVCLIVLSFIAFLTIDAKDLYKTLEITRNATDDEIKKAFRKLSKKFHPDLNPDGKDRYVEISEANEILSNSEKRQIYDMDGYDAVINPRQQQQNFDPFAAMFGRQQQQPGRLPKGSNSIVSMQITLEQLYIGTEVKFTIQRNVICPKCRGNGSHDGELHTCSKCRGQGQVMKMQTIGPGFQVQTQAPCDTCGGRGKVPKNKCHHCHGQRVSKESKELTAVIERGMKHEQQIVFERESEQAPNTTPGDVVAVIHQQPHPRFKRVGDDLHIDLTLSLKESLLGFDRTIQQLDGSFIPIKRQGITQPFDIMILEGHGMPQHGFPSQKGKLHVRCIIAYPQQLTENQKTKINQFLP